MSEINTNATVTPYKAAALIREFLKDEGVDQDFPPQRAYAMTKSGTWENVGGSGGKDGKVLVRLADVAKWFQGYLEDVKAGRVASDGRKDLTDSFRSMVSSTASPAMQDDGDVEADE